MNTRKFDKSSPRNCVPPTAEEVSRRQIAWQSAGELFLNSGVPAQPRLFGAENSTGQGGLHLIAVLALLCHVIPLHADIAADLNASATDLFAGRNYLINFPAKGRNQLRQDYLSVDTNGVASQTPKFDLLIQSIVEAVGVRTEPAKVAVASPQDQNKAQLIAWEALEALLNGQIVAGNGSLLKGLRVAFPNPPDKGSFPGKPGGETTIPFGFPHPANPADAATDGGYRGANITDLCYARLHFQRGVIAALDYINSDSTGEIRATEPANAPFDQYTYFNTQSLPDAEFGSNPQPIQTAGYLLGNALDRLGQAVTGIGDHLWRAAYFDRQRGPSGARQTERPAMLAAASDQLRKGAQFQFLAALPLAAMLSDGSSSSLNDYQVCTLDQTGVTLANDQVFIDRINRGEIPKLATLSLNASTADINQQISYVKTLKADAASKYSLAQAAIWREQDAEATVITDAENIRTQFSDQLAATTGISVGNPSDPPYFGLTTDSGRQQYRNDVFQRIQDALQAPQTAPLLVDGSALGTAVLSMNKAFDELASAKNRIDVAPQQIQIEEDKDNALDAVILGTADQIGAYQLAIGIANAYSITSSASVTFGFGPPSFTASVSLTYNPGAITSARFQAEITRAQAIEQVQMNDINGAAAIRNILVNENQAALDAQAAVAAAQLGVAGVRSLLGQIDRLIQDHIYYQDSNKEKWYSDSALVFQQQSEEIDYQSSLTEYINNLYVLSQILATRWSEQFSNPYLNKSGVPVTLGSSAYDDFTQPESAFNIYQASQGDNLYAALLAWDGILRSERQGGDNILPPVTVSLRRDIFGLTEVRYSDLLQSFVTDTNAVAANIRRFRALLLQKQQPATSPYWLRLEFPMSFNQQLLSAAAIGLNQQPLVIPISQDDWNIRVTQMAAKVDGESSVAQTDTGRLRIQLYQYGKITIPTYFPRQSINKQLLTFDLPLYYVDPTQGSQSAYEFALDAGLGGLPGTPLDTSRIEPTPFCDKYVLLIERRANRVPVNVDKIEDIELTFNLRAGTPAPFAW